MRCTCSLPVTTSTVDVARIHVFGCRRGIPMDDVGKCTTQLMAQLTRCVPTSNAGPDFMCVLPHLHADLDRTCRAATFMPPPCQRPPSMCVCDTPSLHIPTRAVGLAVKPCTTAILVTTVDPRRAEPARRARASARAPSRRRAAGTWWFGRWSTRCSSCR